MRKLLITGFEPFGGEDINPSWEAVKKLPNVIGDYELFKLCIPVVFGEAVQMVINKAEDIAPCAIVCVGQAGGRDAITPELVGINLRNATIPDNKRNKPQDEQIIEGGACAFFSTLPVRKMAQAINDNGIKSHVSYSAGAYVCNDVLYTLLSYFNESEIKVAFIHVPYVNEQGKEPSMILDDIVRALTIAIENI